MSENMNVNSLGQNTVTIEPPFTGTTGTVGTVGTGTVGTVGTGTVGTGTGTTYGVTSIAIGVITIFALAGVIILVYYHTKYGTDFMAAITQDWTRFHAWLNNSLNSSNVVTHDQMNGDDHYSSTSGIPSPHSGSQLSSNSPPNSLNTSHTHIGSQTHLVSAHAIASGLADEMFSGGSFEEKEKEKEKERQFGEDGSVTPSNGRNKTGWCYIGEDHNIRSCVEVGPNDVCASNDVFPSEAHCVNPTLR